uniref:C1q domain-containing protein n=2 Tax=Astatotilapia calliptera TaxID=8154 RepID=A0A3P8P0Q2_ASTCA
MEITLKFSLLLLVCSVSTNQTEADNEILDQQISNQQPCPQEIHAVLRELTASVAEQKVEIRTLKQENKDHVAKLKDLEMQNVELQRQRSEIDKLKQQQQDNAAKLEEVDKQRTAIENLNQQLLVKQVAFSASLLAEGGGITGPFNTHTTLVFKHLVTNIGNAYNPHTGIFTAPVRGAYHFEWYVCGPGDPVYGVAVVLFKNGERIFSAWERQASHFGTASNGASLRLETGDQVFLCLWVSFKIYDNHFHHSTFSGHLLFTM